MTRAAQEQLFGLEANDMAANHTTDPLDPGTPQKDPDEWVTGDETMTAAQASYLKTLSQEAGVAFDETLTKAEASKKIEELQEITGRGIDH